MVESTLWRSVTSVRLGRRLPALGALITLAACGTSAGVHTSRADPLGQAPVSSDAPDNTDPTSGTSPTSGTLDWQTCDDPTVPDPSLECATLQVPLDYDNPTGESIDMAMIRVPARGERQGAVLFNPGGPGASAFDYVAAGGTTYTAALGTQAFDFIGFDPRGVERSSGIRCVSDEFMDEHLYIDDTPDTPDEQALLDESRDGFVDACKEKYGDTLRFYSTANTARDMDAIRAALGDEQLSFLGISYGTYLGATYATLFPDRVRAMVLDSVVETNGDTTRQGYETQLIGFEGAFDNWAAWCEGDATCDFTADDVGARWDTLKQQLDDEPIRGSDGRIANNATMERATKAALYSESEWPRPGTGPRRRRSRRPGGHLRDCRLVQPSQRRRHVRDAVPIVPRHPLRERDAAAAARRPGGVGRDPARIGATFRKEHHRRRTGV